jgi:tryptophanyl-tRNA synthetase
VDIHGCSLADVDAAVRVIEIEFGGYGFYTPSATYHYFMQGLQGGKMSSSVPESFIGFCDTEKNVKKKVMGAITGGRMTLEEQKQLGGEPEKCSVYLLNLFHMLEDDDELTEICRACKAGELMCGTCKKATYERVKEFLTDFNERMDEVAHKVDER